MIYTFGVMSNKWSLEANDINVAYSSMAIFLSKNIPIAVYSPLQYSFMPEDVLRENEVLLKDELFIKDLKNCLKSIKEVSL